MMQGGPGPAPIISQLLPPPELPPIPPLPPFPLLPVEPEFSDPPIASRI